jgi:hypothetical protein
VTSKNAWLFRGAALVSALMLAACASPMGQREAEQRASRSLNAFCHQTPCGTPRLVRAQKLGGRWLVDFETGIGLYTVAVDGGGNANVSVWDKNAPR